MFESQEMKFLCLQLRIPFLRLFLAEDPGDHTPLRRGRSAGLTTGEGRGNTAQRFIVRESDAWDKAYTVCRRSKLREARDNRTERAPPEGHRAKARHRGTKLSENKEVTCRGREDLY